jgi:hypothetical protein
LEISEGDLRNRVIEVGAVAPEGNYGFLLNAIIFTRLVLPSKHRPFASESRRRRRGGHSSEITTFGWGNGAGMFLEKGAKLGGSDLWMNARRDPKEVEGIVGRTLGH